jgi:hypothetical protein
MQLDTQTILAAIAALWAVVLALATAYAKVQGDRLMRERELTDRCDTQMKDLLHPLVETVAAIARALEAQGAMQREIAEYVSEQRLRDKLRSERSSPQSRGASSS